MQQMEMSYEVRSTTRNDAFDQMTTLTSHPDANATADPGSHANGAQYRAPAFRWRSLKHQNPHRQARSVSLWVRGSIHSRSGVWSADPCMHACDGQAPNVQVGRHS